MLFCARLLVKGAGAITFCGKVERPESKGKIPPYNYRIYDRTESLPAHGGSETRASAPIECYIYMHRIERSLSLRLTEHRRESAARSRTGYVVRAAPHGMAIRR